MSSYKNFQSDNAKHTNRSSRSNYNASCNNAVEAKSTSQQSHLERNIDKYVEFISWCRWYPDLFLDLIHPKKNGKKTGFTLHSDQRVFMRIAVRFLSMYGVFPRSYAKTWNEVIVMFICCVLYPGIEFALTAQTKENAAGLLKAKYDDIVKKYPWFKNEIYDTKFSKNDGSIGFVNKSSIGVLANNQTSKGQRRHAIMIEESALIDDFTFQDALKPIADMGRLTVGTWGIKNPEELDQKISFFTTSGYRQSDEYYRSLKMVQSMIELQNGDFVLGGDWKLACWYGRGSNKQQIYKKKRDESPIAFAQNYESKWVGNADSQLVNIQKLLNLRNLTRPEYEYDGNSEYVMGVDVARSENTSNAQSSVAILKIIRNSNGRIINIELVNLYNISNNMAFANQSIELKKIRQRYNAKVVALDTNGLGVGLCDELMRESFDPDSGKSLGCWDTMNTDKVPEISNCPKYIYEIKPQAVNSEAITVFIDMVESGKLKLLEKRENIIYDVNDSEDYIKKVLPFLNTDFLIQEISNLKLKNNSGGKLSVEHAIKRMDKDRYTALIYGLWYIKAFEDNVYVEEKDDLDLLLQYTFL